jgi:hypothetical protein
LTPLSDSKTIPPHYYQDIEDIPEEDIRQAWSLVKRSSTLKEKSMLAANVVLRVAFVCALSLGPNFLYVWLTTNKNITSSIKEYGLVAITVSACQCLKCAMMKPIA